MTQTPAATQSQGAVVLLPLDLLTSFPLQPRTVYNEVDLQDLRDSIKASGVVQPILVRCVNELQYEVIDGNRRVRAAQAADIRDIPAIVQTLTDAQALEVALIQGVRHANLHPLDEANGYKRLMELEKLNAPRIAAKLGANRDYVSKRLQLTRLNDIAQAAFRTGDIETTHATMIAPLDQDVQTDAVEYVVNKQATAVQLRAWIDRLNGDKSEGDGDNEDSDSGKDKKPARAPNIVTAKAVESFALALAKLKPKDIAGDEVMLDALSHLAQRSAEKLLLATRVKEKQPKEKKPKPAKPKAAPRKK